MTSRVSMRPAAVKGADLTTSFEAGPGRRVIAGLRPAADMAVDAGIDQPCGEGWAEQEMVDAKAGIARPAVSHVVPERIDRIVWMQMADRVGPALLQQSPEGRAAFGLEQRVVVPGLGRIDVAIGRHDIEITGQDHRR